MELNSKNNFLSIFNKDLRRFEEENKKKETLDLIKLLEETKKEIQVAFNNFEETTDPDLIDYYIYFIKALEKRCNYIIKAAKTKGIKV